MPSTVPERDAAPLIRAAALPGDCPADSADGAQPVTAVAVGVIERGRRVLIARRSPDRHQGDRWEFPGGKLAAGESAPAALARELREELGIEVIHAQPLMTVAHDYPDRRVRLQVFRVTQFDGRARGCEGQAIRWVSKADLPDYRFPDANRPIVNAVRLPSAYLITAPQPSSPETFLADLTQAYARADGLVQFRAPALHGADWFDLAARTVCWVQAQGGRILVNGSAAAAQRLAADGVHLNSRRLLALSERPLSPDYWVAASCHNANELRHARRIGVDFVVLGPMYPTASHPGAAVLGEAQFAALAAAANLPAYALGGLTLADWPRVRGLGAQGIAGISAFWPAG